MPNTVRLHRVLVMKREKVYRAFIEPDAMVPTWQPGHFQAAPLWQPVGRSGLTVLSNVRCRQLRCVAALGRTLPFVRQALHDPQQLVALLKSSVQRSYRRWRRLVR